MDSMSVNICYTHILACLSGLPESKYAHCKKDSNRSGDDQKLMTIGLSHMVLIGLTMSHKVSHRETRLINGLARPGTVSKALPQFSLLLNACFAIKVALD